MRNLRKTSLFSGGMRAALAVSAAAVGVFGGIDFATADATDPQVLQFLRTCSAADLAAKGNLGATTAQAIVRFRNGPDGVVGTTDDAKLTAYTDLRTKSASGTVSALSASTRNNLVTALKKALDQGGGGGGGGGAPLDSVADQKKFAEALLAEVITQDFTRWENYPGLGARRERMSVLRDGRAWGIAQARTPSEGPFAGGETWGTSFFNPSGIAYVKANLYPMAVLKKAFFTSDGKRIPGKKIEFPADTVIVKCLFTTAIKPGMFQIDAGTTKDSDTAQTHKVGLAQMDISTKRLGYTDAWTWTTFEFDPAAKNTFKLSVLKRNGSYVATRFESEPSDPSDRKLNIDADKDPAQKPGQHFAYMGHIDNPASSCIACHQGAEYPQASISALVNASTHLMKAPLTTDANGVIIPPFRASGSNSNHPLKGQELRVDYMWEVAQSLQDWEDAHPGFWPKGNKPDPDEGPISGITKASPSTTVKATFTANGGPVNDVTGITGAINNGQ